MEHTDTHLIRECILLMIGRWEVVMRNNPLSQTTTIIYRSAMSTCKRSFMDELGNCPYSFKKEESEGDRPLTSPKCAAVLPNL